MANSTGTYNKMAKWFKRTSLFILLIPLANTIIAIVSLVLSIQAKEQIPDQSVFDTLAKVYIILIYVLLVLSIVWVILNIILFLTAGTVKQKASSGSFRIWLFISFALVLSPIILAIVFHYLPQPWLEQNNARTILEIVMPAIVALGYVIGYCSARRAYKETL